MEHAQKDIKRRVKMYSDVEETTMNLGDIPDLSGVTESNSGFEPFQDGWYFGTILAQRAFTDRNGNDVTFVSSDAPSQNADSRNIRLQIEIKRQSDGRTHNTSAFINYRPEDLTQEMVEKITAYKEKVKDGEQWGTLFRPFMALKSLGKLQNIAGVRQLQHSPDGGLDLTPVYGKTGYFKLTPDNRNPQYKQVSDFSNTAPKGKKAVLL